MSLLNRFAVLVALLPLSACNSSSHFDRHLNPPADAQWVTLSVKVPENVETLPMDVLYRSQICQEKAYDNLTESHVKLIPAHNANDVSLVRQDGSDIYQARIAINGGSSCQWSLSVIRMRLQFKTDSSLARGKESISSSTTFIFDELGEKSSLLSGNPKDVYGDQHIIIKYFPSIFVNHLMNESYLDLFAGDTRRDKWSRTYKVHDAKNIFVESILESKKVVMLESPNPPPGDIMITYPDGSISHSSKTYADYEKLLSIE